MKERSNKRREDLLSDDSGWNEWGKYVLISLKDLDDTDAHIYGLFDDFRSSIDNRFSKIQDDNKIDNTNALKLIAKNSSEISSLRTKLNILISIFTFLATGLLSIIMLLLKVYLENSAIFGE